MGCAPYLLTAFTTGLIKRPDSKLLMISTSAGDLDSPLGRLRRRAMGMANVRRAGPVVEAKSRDFHWHEWSLGEQHELDNSPCAASREAPPLRDRGSLERDAAMDTANSGSGCSPPALSPE